MLNYKNNGTRFVSGKATVIPTMIKKLVLPYNLKHTLKYSKLAKDISVIKGLGQLHDITSNYLTFMLIGSNMLTVGKEIWDSLNTNETKLKEVRLTVLTISKAAMAREAGIDVKTYGAIEAGIKPGRDVTRESIRNAVSRLLMQKNLKPLSTEGLFHR